VKNQDFRKDELPNGVFGNQSKQAIFAQEQPAIAHNAKDGAGILDEFALILMVQKQKNSLARREQKQVHLIFEQNT
jgi:hypothetical protein